MLSPFWGQHRVPLIVDEKSLTIAADKGLYTRSSAASAAARSDGSSMHRARKECTFLAVLEVHS